MSDISGSGVEPGAGAVNPPVRPTGQRIVLGVVIGLGVLLILGFGALAVGLARNLGGHRPAAAPETSLVLPPGAQIEQMQVSDDRLILKVKTATGEEIDIVDVRDGHVVSRIAAAPPDVPH